MVTVDSHAHIWGRGFLPPAFFREAAEGWAAKAPDRAPGMILDRLLDGVVDETGDDFVGNMDAAGVDTSFVMMLDAGAPLFGEEPATALAAQIEFYADLQQRHPGRLYTHAMIDHRRPECLELIGHAVAGLGLIGIGEITPDGFAADDEGLRPLMRLAADLGVPVQIHTRAGIWTDMAGRDRSERNPAHPVHVARLARDLPDLRIVLCHAGFPNWWQAAAEAIADHENCVLDLSNWNEMLDEPEEIVARLATLRSLVGSDRILFGSDQASGRRFTGARSRLKDWVAMVRDLPDVAAHWGYRFSREEADRILGLNALRFYGLA